MTPPANTERYKHHRFPGEIISHGVWLYYRFPLSYSAAKREVMPGVEHRQSRYLNNRCENSHRPTRQCERRMQGFKSPGHAQRFLSAYGPIGFCQVVEAETPIRRRFHPRSHKHAGVKRPVLLYVGRISREKNLFAYLDLAIEGTKYVVGDGPLLGKLKRLYHRDATAGRVVFFGELQGRALAELYAEANVFVFPSKTDTFGNVILEALASGLPVAAYPVPGPIDILVGQHVGALHDNLALAVHQALAQGEADACLALARRYSWEAATERFLNAIVPVDA